MVTILCGETLGRGEVMDEKPFGRYRLVSLIGEGGMGQVFRAFDTETERTVAVKVLPPHLAKDEKFQERFRREAHAAAGLADPHIVPIHDFGEIEGRLYVDMRLIDGRDLEAVLADGPMDPERAVSIIEQVAGALDAAHRIGLVHRDVKPTNVLVGERDFAYLIDFGIARGTGEVGVTSTGQTIGTLSYMAPERFATGMADFRSDVYALACVLYQCLTGMRPYAGDSLEQQIAGHMIAPPPRPSAHRLGIPSTFDEVIATGLAKDPDRRYQTASDLGHAARRALTAAAAAASTNVLPAAPTHVGSGPLVATHAGAPAPPQPPQPPVMWQSGPQPIPPQMQSGPQPIPPRMPTGPVPQRQPSWWQRNIVGVAAVIALVVTVVAVTMILATGGGEDVPKPTADIDTLLASRQDIDSIMDERNLVATRRYDKIPGDTSTISPEECHSIVYSAGEREFSTTGFMAMREEILVGSGDSPPVVDQAVFQVPAPDRAQTFLETMAEQWQGCLNKDITSTPFDGSAATEESFEDFVQKDDLISVQQKSDTGGGQNCQRALSIKGNYIADVRACGDSVTDQAETIATNILSKVG